MPLIEIWINCPDVATARTIADAVIDRRLAAAANRFPTVESSYRWHGTVRRATEVPLRLKTRAELFDAVAEAVRALHPYRTPGIHAVAAARATDDYLAWIRAETAGA